MNETHPSIEQIVDYLHGELSPARDAAIHAHLAACTDCEEQRAHEVAITETLRAHARATERELPASVVAKIRQSVTRSSAPSLGERLRAALRPVVLFPAAAVAAAILYIGVGVWREHSAEPAARIDAASYIENHAAMAATAPFGDDTPILTSDDEAR
jgi:anti-sigma factor RsiW